ncbi:MAG TPA: glucose 1-dehydrogenase [Mycobacteriales bacterium]|nr:glucose 1-dehydrogenase [Mycobacteriales bacterium]
MTIDQFSRVDPRSQYPRPPYGEQQQEHPGSGPEMSPIPDHGEKTYRGSGRLGGTKAVITGADSGIGRAAAIAFAREGADIVLSYLPEEETEARQVVGLIEDAGQRALAVPGDVSEESYCRQLIDRAVGEFGHVDVLVSNAAYQMAVEGFRDISTEQFDHTMKTNIYALFWLCQAVVPNMPAGGSIIATSSIQAVQPSPSLLDYASTKGAIMNFTKGLALELAEQGIRVNSVAPGPIWTPLIPSTMPPERVSEFGQDTPLGRAGQPAELAPAFVYLASPESSYVTGQVLGVTGGRPVT